MFVAPRVGPTGMAELALQGVSKIFANHVAAVQDLNLTIRDQELVVLVGPSGCGKTTTLRLIAGLDDLSHGAIRFDGRLVNQVPPRNRNVAMVFQHSALYPHLSVYNNIAFGLRMRYGGHGIQQWWTRLRHPIRRPTLMSSQAIGAEVLRAARILALDHLLDRLPRELSGGERQRVALGRAIVRRPAAFLLDEPLSSLDPQLRGEMRRELKRLQRQLGATMVYVTHDQAEAMALGDRMAVMHGGRLQQVGTPREVYERPANLPVARFVGEPAMNIVPGCVRRGGDGYRFFGGGLSVPLPRAEERWGLSGLASADGLATVLGIRCEHLSVVISDPAGQLGRDGAISPAGQSPAGQWEARGARHWCGQGRVLDLERLGATVMARVGVLPRAGECKSSDEELRKHGSTRDEAGRTVLAVALPATRTVQMGAHVAMFINTTQTHLFDVRTGQNCMRVTIESSGESTDLPGLDREP